VAPQSWRWAVRTGRALCAVAFLAALYATWVGSPISQSRTMEGVYLEGAAGAVVLGVILAFAVPHLIDAALVVCGGIMVGHAWALQHMTDIPGSFWMALVDTVAELRRYHLLLVVLALGSWSSASLARQRFRARTDVSRA
jgi:hypothetical protein